MKIRILPGKPRSTGWRDCSIWTQPQASPNKSRNSGFSQRGVSLNVLTRIPNVQVAEVQRREILPALDAHSQTLDDVANGKLPQSELPVHLRKIDDSPKGVTFSATQLLTFNSDPDAYFLRYHRGFFESDYEFLTRFAEADALSLLKGKIVHKMLEDGLPADEGELLARLDDAFFQYEIFDEEERTDFRREIPALMLPFIASDTAQEIFGAAAFHNELSLTMRIADDFFTGTLDRVYQNGSGEWEVIDYKTNNIKAAEVQKTGEKYGMQMKGYALLLAQVFPGKRAIGCGCIFSNRSRCSSRCSHPRMLMRSKTSLPELSRKSNNFNPLATNYPPTGIDLAFLSFRACPGILLLFWRFLHSQILNKTARPHLRRSAENEHRA
ncbi:MAG: PD-(D/E)XK nuclease family protein [Calditrichia bacterium]